MTQIWYLVTSFISVPHIVGNVFGPVRFLLFVCRLGWFLYTLNIYAHFSAHFSQQLSMAEIWYGGYGFLFRSEIFFRTTQELEYFFCRAKRKFFFQNLTLGYMTKSEYFFSNIGNQNIFLEKNHNPPFKLNGRSLICNLKYKSVQVIKTKIQKTTQLLMIKLAGLAHNFLDVKIVLTFQ